MEVYSVLETGMVATSVIVGLSLATWLLFRIDQKGEKSLFSKIMEPYDEEIEKPTSILEVSPFFHKGSTETLLKPPDQSPNPEDAHDSIRPAKGGPYEIP